MHTDKKDLHGPSMKTQLHSVDMFKERVTILNLFVGGEIDFPERLKEVVSLKSLVLYKTYSREATYHNLPTSLTSLHLAHYEISNCIPSRGAIDHLRGLREFCVAHCNYRLLVPNWLPSSLTTLVLRFNRMIDISSELWLGLTNLQRLNLEGNDIRDLPIEMKHLTRLEVINLDNNIFEDFPDCLSEWANLKELSFSNNYMGSGCMALSKLSRLTSLEILSLRHNKLHDVFSKNKNNVLHLPSLKKIELCDNLLTALPVISPETNNVREVRINNNLIRRIPTHFVKPFIHTLNDIQFHSNMTLSAISLEFVRSDVSPDLWCESFGRRMSHQLFQSTGLRFYPASVKTTYGCKEFLHELLTSKERVIKLILSFSLFVSRFTVGSLCSSIPLDGDALSRMVGSFIIQTELNHFAERFQCDTNIIASFYLA